MKPRQLCFPSLNFAVMQEPVLCVKVHENVSVCLCVCEHTCVYIMRASKYQQKCGLSFLALLPPQALFWLLLHKGMGVITKL